MPRSLIDANLLYRFAVWRGEVFEHVFGLGEFWSDLEIWRYAQENDLVIVTKDADFSDWVMLSEPPPEVIHLRLGNMRMRDFYQFIQNFGLKLHVLSNPISWSSFMPTKLSVWRNS